MSVRVSAWIEKIPGEPGAPSPGPAREETVDAESYEAGKAKILELLPNGWRIMNWGVDRDPGTPACSTGNG